MDINTVIDPILQIRQLKVTDLIFLNPKVLHLIVGHATYIPMSGSTLESSIEWHYYCLWSSVQERNLKLFLHSFLHFGSRKVWKIVQWSTDQVIMDPSTSVSKVRAEFSWEHLKLLSPAQLYQKEGDLCCLSQTLTLKYWLLQNWQKNTS